MVWIPNRLLFVTADGVWLAITAAHARVAAVRYHRLFEPVFVYIHIYVCIYTYIFFFQCHHHMFLWTFVVSSWSWRYCSRLLRLGRPWGATTLSRRCEWWYAGRWNTRRGLKPKSTNYPDHGHNGNLSLQGKTHGTTGNRTRDLMISSQRPWPLDHEAGHIYLHNTCPLKFTLQVRCSVYMFTSPNTTLGRMIFPQRAYEFISLSCMGPDNRTAVRHSMVHAIDVH